MVSASTEERLRLRGVPTNRNSSSSPRRLKLKTEESAKSMLQRIRAGTSADLFSSGKRNREMDRGPVTADSLLRHFAGYHVFNDIRPGHIASEPLTIWDDESPFPRMRPSWTTTARTIPILIEEPLCERTCCKDSVVIVDDDDKKGKGGSYPESPIPKNSSSKFSSAESNHSGLQNKLFSSREIPILVDDADGSIDKRKRTAEVIPSCGSGNDRTKPNRDMCHRDLRLSSLSSACRNDDSINQGNAHHVANKYSGFRNIPVIILDDSGSSKKENITLNNQSEGSLDRKEFSLGNNGSSCDEKDVNTPPNYPIYETLHELLLHENRQIDYIRGDGNCFFRALSKHLYGSERFHKAIRSLIIDLIATHKKEFAQFIDNEDVQHHVESISEDRSWATTCEVYAAATLLQRDLYMLTPSTDLHSYKWLLFTPVFPMEPQCREGGNCQQACFISLCNTNGNHYDRVVALHGGCNCFLTCPQLDGISCNVDLTA